MLDLLCARPRRPARRLRSSSCRGRRLAAEARIAIVGVGSIGISAIAGADRHRSPSWRAARSRLHQKLSGPGSPSPASRRMSASTSTRCRWSDDAGRDLRQLSHPPLLRRVHGRGRGLQPLLRLHEPVRRLDAGRWCSADNLLFLYLGWEGVGLCSYLLIGFWYRDPANGLAARKAFIVTRVGDTAHGDRTVSPLHAPGHARHPDADAASRCAVAGRHRRCRSPRRRCCSAARSASRRSCRCRPGCPTRWPARRRSAR